MYRQFVQFGIGGHTSKKRGRLRNHAYPATFREDVLSLVTSRRVERMNKTLQDRLVKELRLRNISDIVSANEYLPEFIAKFNAQFAKIPANPKNLHRTAQEWDLNDDIFAWKELRTVSNNLTLLYDRVVYLIDDIDENRNLKRKEVEFFDYPDGTVAIKHKGRVIRFNTYDKVQR